MLSPNMASSIIVIISLMIILSFLGSRVAKMDPAKPIKGPIFLVIMLINMLNQSIKKYFGDNWKKFAPMLIGILLYLGLANTVSLFGLATPLSNINIALGFSLMAFLIIQISALVVRNPLKRIKDLMSPIPFLLPLNIIGEISTTTAMGLRLFGNILSGAVIGVIVMNILPTLVAIIPMSFVVHPIFNIGFGLIQAFVYFMLLMIFLSIAVETEEI